MRAQIRRLPHINQLYERRKSYELHLRKMSIIKQTKQKLRISANLNINQNDAKDNQRMHFKTEPNETQQSIVSVQLSQPQIQNNQKDSHAKLPKIVQSLDVHKKKWNNPHRKKIEEQIKAQNIRLKKRVNSTSKNLNQDYKKIDSIKKRICRFSLNPQTYKIQLKTEKSLQKIEIHHRMMSQNTKSRQSLHQKAEKSNQKRANNPLSSCKFSIFTHKSLKSEVSNKSNPSQIQSINNHSLKQNRVKNHKRNVKIITSTTPINRIANTYCNSLNKNVQASKFKISNDKQNRLKSSLSNQKPISFKPNLDNNRPASFYSKQGIFKNKVIQNFKSQSTEKIKQNSLLTGKCKQAKLIYKYQTRSQRPSENKFQYVPSNRQQNQTSLSNVNQNQIKIEQKIQKTIAKVCKSKQAINQTNLFPTQPQR